MHEAGRGNPLNFSLCFFKRGQREAFSMYYSHFKDVLVPDKMFSHGQITTLPRKMTPGLNQTTQFVQSNFRFVKFNSNQLTPQNIFIKKI